jgi:hypothetical protein
MISAKRMMNSLVVLTGLGLLGLSVVGSADKEICSPPQIMYVSCGTAKQVAKPLVLPAKENVRYIVTSVGMKEEGVVGSLPGGYIPVRLVDVNDDESDAIMAEGSRKKIREVAECMRSENEKDISVSGTTHSCGYGDGVEVRVNAPKRQPTIQGVVQVTSCKKQSEKEREALRLLREIEESDRKIAEAERKKAEAERRIEQAKENIARAKEEFWSGKTPPSKKQVVESDEGWIDWGLRKSGKFIDYGLEQVKGVATIENVQSLTVNSILSGSSKGVFGGGMFDLGLKVEL